MSQPQLVDTWHEEQTQEQTPIVQLIHEQMRREERWSRWRVIISGIGVIALLAIAYLFTRVLDDQEQLRETSVDFASQVRTAICGDPTFAHLCQEATEIVEDPANPEPVAPQPGPPGEDGKDAPPPSDDQVSRLLQPMVQPAVNEWFRSNPPDSGVVGEPIPGPEGPMGPQGEEGPMGPAGPPGAMTCPGGGEPITFRFNGTANIGLPEGTYLICPA